MKLLNQQLVLYLLCLTRNFNIASGHNLYLHGSQAQLVTVVSHGQCVS